MDTEMNRNVQTVGVHAVMGTPQHLLSCLELDRNAWLGSPGALADARTLRFSHSFQTFVTFSNMQKARIHC